MKFTSLQLAVLFGISVFAVLGAAYNLLRAMQVREELVAHAEDVAADPEVLSDPMRRRSFLVRWADRYDRSPNVGAIRERLRKAYVRWRPSDYRVIRLALGVGTLTATWLVFNLPPIPSVLIALGAYFVVPRIFFAMRRNAYVHAFEAQLVEITQLLANSLRAGMSVQQSIGQVVDRVPEPAQTEFRQTNHELMLGDNLAMALNGLRQRLHSRDLDVIVNAIVVQHQAGGNLARVLAAMANVLTERQRLSSEIRSLTAEARFSALIIMLLPIIMILLIRDSPLGETLFETPFGWGLLTAFAVVQVVVYFIIQRIAKIEV